MKKLMYLWVCLLSAYSIHAQTPVFSEDFSGGSIPAGWLNQDTSANATPALWTWCSNPANPSEAGCPSIWADANNQQSPFASTTAANGFVTLDSDEYGNIPTDHISLLTMPAQNFTAASQVWIQFQSHIGVYTYPADENALLRVSTDGITWTNFQVFTDLSTSARWSANPQLSSINISSVAAGQSTVYIQFYWRGNYDYQWSIDDIKVFNVDPRLPNDLRINDNFYAIAPNAMTPKSQVVPFGFIADIANLGSTAQTNVKLNMTIRNSGTNAIVYNEDYTYGTVATDTTVENHLFQSAGFTPPAQVADYLATYTLTAANPDQLPADNTISFDFCITDTLFAKEKNGPTRPVRPAPNNWEEVGEPHAWAYGNCFYVPNGAGFYSRYITFSIGATGETAGRNVLIGLYRWEDANGDGNADPDERDRLGFYEYVILGDENYQTPITVLAENLLDENSPIALQDDSYYLVTMEYTPNDQVGIDFGANEDYDYAAMNFRSDSLGTPYYAGMLGVKGDLTVEPFSRVGFGLDIVPFVRWSIGENPLTNSTENVLGAEHITTLTPNPANTTAMLTLHFATIMRDVQVKMIDAQGKIVQTRTLGELKQSNVALEVAALPNGIYSVQVATPQGVRTHRLVVQH